MLLHHLYKPPFQKIIAGIFNLFLLCNLNIFSAMARFVDSLNYNNVMTCLDLFEQYRRKHAPLAPYYFTFIVIHSSMFKMSNY